MEMSVHLHVPPTLPTEKNPHPLFHWIAGLDAVEKRKIGFYCVVSIPNSL
jgi:hypothetical protein